MGERLKPRLLGYAFYWGWTLLCFQSTVLFMPATRPDLNGGFPEFFTASIAATVASHLLWAWVIARRPRLCTSTPWVAAVLQSASVLVAGLGAGWLPPAALVAAGVLSGIASAFMDVRWSQVYGELPGGTSGQAVTLSVVLGGLLFFGISAVGRVSPLATVALLCLLPPACAYALGLNDRPDQQPRPAPASWTPIAISLWRPVVGSLVFFFAYGCVEGMVHGRVDFNGAHGVAQICCTAAALLMFAILRNRRHVSANGVYGLTMALVAAGFMILPLVIRHGDGNGAGLTAAMAFVSVGTSIFDIVLLCAIAHTAWTHRVSGAVVNGAVRGVTVGFSAVGNIAGRTLASSLWSGAVDLIIIVLAVTYLFILSASFFVGRRRNATLDLGETDATEEPPVEKTTASAASQATEQTPGPADLEQLLDERIGRIAAEKSLSPREADVFALMARGRSLPYIAETLVLSENTIRSHTRRIYSKLGVHSKQETLDLLSQEAGAQ